MTNQIHYAKQAIRDLDEISDYITEKLYNPSAASQTVSGILKSVRILAEQPGAGVPLLLEDGLSSGYRYVMYKNYLAFYRVAENHIYVDRILYGKRDYMALLFRSSEEE